jgi:hypothetical protein
MEHLQSFLFLIAGLAPAPRPILNWWVGRPSPHKRGAEEFLAVAGLAFALDKLDQHVSQHASGGL